MELRNLSLRTSRLMFILTILKLVMEQMLGEPILELLSKSFLELGLNLRMMIPMS
jgi:hypothetical protein